MNPIAADFVHLGHDPGPDLHALVTIATMETATTREGTIAATTSIVLRATVQVAAGHRQCRYRPPTMETKATTGNHRPPRSLRLPRLRMRLQLLVVLSRQMCPSNLRNCHR